MRADTSCIETHEHVCQALWHICYVKTSAYNIADQRIQELGSVNLHRGYLLFRYEYQIYFIECIENISIFTSAQHE